MVLQFAVPVALSFQIIVLQVHPLAVSRKDNIDDSCGCALTNQSPHVGARPCLSVFESNEGTSSFISPGHFPPGPLSPTVCPMIQRHPARPFCS